MTKQKTIQVKGKVVLRRLGEDCLLVPVSGMAAQENCVFPVNETGVFIWERLSTGQSVDSIVQAMTESFNVSAEAAASDCQSFVNELLSQHLLEEGVS
jgi:Coenzyme PQQ synthesis protein D (PqqD)